MNTAIRSLSVGVLVLVSAAPGWQDSAAAASQKTDKTLAEGKTFEELTEIIDGFYQENPDKEDLSVIRVVWDVTIVPNITTGIAGEPLDAE